MKKERSQILLNFEQRVAVLPSVAVNFVDKARKFDLKVLLLVSSSEKYREGKYLSALAEALGAEEKDVETSLAFWNGTGILTLDPIKETETLKKQAETEPSADKKTEKVKKADKEDSKKQNDGAEQVSASTPRRVKLSELPQYSSEELNRVIERHKGSVELIDECQRILGKMFLASDIKVLMALIDYLDLNYDYVLVLVNYCDRHDMRSMRAIEKLAISCIDDGYRDAATLDSALRAREEREDIEYKIRTVFGANERKLTAKEKKHIEAWITTYKFDLDVIEKAYDITVNSTTKPSMHYANAILEKWYTAGARSLEDVQALLSAREIEKEKEGSSFDVDDFFNAALKRSYSDKV